MSPEGKSPKQWRDPAEEKRLSYERQGRNRFGENDKASRTAIPAFKARTNRELRRKAGAIMRQIEIGADQVSHADRKLAEMTFHATHPRERKLADEPLGAVLAARGDIEESVIGARRRASVRARLSDRRLYR